MAADPNFKTFEAAYPYVVRKLLTDNSPAMRKILHSVWFSLEKCFMCVCVCVDVYVYIDVRVLYVKVLIHALKNSICNSIYCDSYL